MLFLLLAFFAFAFANEFVFANPYGSIKERNITGFGPDPSEQLVGFVTVPGPVDTSSNNHYFYYFFGARHNPSTAPLLVWYSGGPACSSLLAMTFENGPWNISSDGSFLYNPYSWNEVANVLWIEMPVNTGFSYSESYVNDDTSEDQIAEQMWLFFQVWLPAHAKLSSRPMLQFAESYGGHYNPAVSSYFVSQNLKKQGQNINLVGMAIGNGLTDPLHQYAGYEPFALENDLVDDLIAGEMDAAYEVCWGLLQAGLWDAAYVECMEGVVMPPLLANPGMNMYNIKVPCEPGQQLCYDFDAVTAFFNSPSVQDKLGVTGYWQTCNMVEHALFFSDWSHSFAMDVPPLLSNDVPVLIYAGTQDYVCNWETQVQWLNQLPWSGLKGYLAAPTLNWTLNGQVAGQMKSYQNLQFLKVFGAGHMVPHDQPQVALAIVKQFINQVMAAH